MDFSKEQTAIFDWFGSGKGNLVVRARAGTGKTTTILKGLDGAPEGKILACAFASANVKDIQSKINNPRAEVKTLHGLGNGFVRRSQPFIKLDKDLPFRERREWSLAYRVASDAPDPIIKLVGRLHTKVREIAPFTTKVEEVISLAYRFDLLPDEEWDEVGWTIEVVAEKALEAVDLAKERTSTMDFADMLFLPLVHKFVRPTYDMVVVDEAQDMSESQLMLAQKACKGRIVVVGDDRQAIYAFRGADSGSLDRLKKELQATELGLTTTYRCPKKIVAEAARLVPDYRAAPSAPDGEILFQMQEKMLLEAKEGDFILSRVNAPLVKICLALLKRRIRAKIKGRDIGSGLLSRLQSFGIKNLTDLGGVLQAWRQEEHRRLQGVDEETAATRIEFINDQCELFINLSEGLTSVGELEARIRDLFVEDAERQAVMCSSVHRAKGLETDKVYLLQETFKKEGGEEGNIRYVAITRTKKTLVWVKSV